jgi:glutathione S-transferase
MTKDPSMKLYYLAGACSLASYIALIEAGLKFEAAAIDRKSRKTAAGEELNRLNPKGYVPILRLDNGELLTENVAVLQYIADRNPASKLAPTFGTMERYRLMEWLSFINSEIHKSFGPLLHAAASEDMKKFARDNLEKRLGWLNGALGSKNFLMGDTFTVADAYLYVVIGWLSRVGIDLAQWPNLKRLHERVGARPSVIAAMKGEGLIK